MKKLIFIAAIFVGAVNLSIADSTINQGIYRWIEFGDQINGLALCKTTSQQLKDCDQLYIQSGPDLLRDNYFLTDGKRILEQRGIYFPENHSDFSYQIKTENKEWKYPPKEVAFQTTIESQFGKLSIMQLSEPHAPFVYIKGDQDIEGIHRLPYPADFYPRFDYQLIAAKLSKHQNKTETDSGNELVLDYKVVEMGAPAQAYVESFHYKRIKGVGWKIKND